MSLSTSVSDPRGLASNSSRRVHRAGLHRAEGRGDGHRRNQFDRRQNEEYLFPSDLHIRAVSKTTDKQQHDYSLNDCSPTTSAHPTTITGLLLPCSKPSPASLLLDPFN